MVAICPEKRRLTEGLAGVLKRILDLHSLTSEAVIAGHNAAPGDVTAELSVAQTRRAALLAGLKAHSRTHGC